MQTFDQSLYFLWQNKLISYEEALRWASNPDEFKLKVMGIQSSQESAMEEMEKTVSGGSASLYEEQ